MTTNGVKDKVDNGTEEDPQKKEEQVPKKDDPEEEGDKPNPEKQVEKQAPKKEEKTDPQPADVEKEKERQEKIKAWKTKKSSALTACTKMSHQVDKFKEIPQSWHVVNKYFQEYRDLAQAYMNAFSGYYKILTVAEAKEVRPHHDERIGDLDRFVDATDRWLQQNAPGKEKQDNMDEIPLDSQMTAQEAIKVAHIQSRAQLASLEAERQVLHKCAAVQEELEALRIQQASLEAKCAMMKIEKDIAVAMAKENVLFESLQPTQEEGRGLNPQAIPFQSQYYHHQQPYQPYTPHQQQQQSAKDERQHDFTFQQSAQEKDERLQAAPGEDKLDIPRHGDNADLFKQPKEEIGQPKVDSNLSFDLLQQQKRMTTAFILPNVEIDNFSGDVILYHSFVRSFEARVANVTDNDHSRLCYLDQYLEGEPKSLIGGCLLNPDASQGYKDARALLQKTYGDPYRVSAAYVQKLMDWPMVKYDDAKGLKEYSLFITRCYHAMQNLSEMTCLNSVDNLQKIIKKLPGNLQSKFRDKQMSIREKKGAVHLKDVQEFILLQADTANDPAFGTQAMATPVEKYTGKYPRKPESNAPFKRSSFAVGASEADGMNNRQQQANSYKRLCFFCEGPHDLDKCGSFMKKPLEERVEWVRNQSMCFGCYNKNHVSKDCTRRRHCEHCSWAHPTALCRRRQEEPLMDETSSLAMNQE